MYILSGVLNIIVCMVVFWSNKQYSPSDPIYTVFCGWMLLYCQGC